MKTILLTIFILTAIIANCQSKAESYFSIIRQAEDKIVQNKLDSALYFYSNAFDEFDTPFVRELLQATTVASFMDDLREIRVIS